MIVDGPNLVMRSVYAMKSGHSFSNQGAYTGPLVLFIKTFGYFVREHEPDDIVVCWEGGRSEFRHEIFDDYKANRSTEVHPLRDISFQLVQIFLALNNIPQRSIEGYEADDVIAALWARHRRTHEIFILSGDKDLLQLVGENVTQIRLGNGGTQTTNWGTDEVVEKFGCTPELLPTLMALMGDRGDGVPGVPGLGPKKALKALESHGWDLTTTEHPAIMAHRDQALMSYDLVNLRTPKSSPNLVGQYIVFSPPKPGSSRYEQLIHFLEQYNLQEILNQVQKDTLWRNNVQTTPS